MYKFFIAICIILVSCKTTKQDYIKILQNGGKNDLISYYKSSKLDSICPRQALILSSCFNKNKEVSAYIFKKFINKDSLNSSYISVLLTHLVINDNFELFKKVLDMAEVDLTSCLQENPLILSSCIKDRSTKFIKYLVESGLDININLNGDIRKTPLYLAISYNNYEITRYLLENGAKTKQNSENGENGLIEYSLECREKHNRSYKRKLSSTSENYLPVYDSKIIELVLVNEWPAFTTKEKYQLLSYLLEENNIALFCSVISTLTLEEINNTSPDKTLELYKNAVSVNDPAFLKEIINTRFPIDKMQDGIYTPLMKAFAKALNIEVVKMLVEDGWNIKATDKGKNTMLHFAASNPSPAFAGFLIDDGSDIDINNIFKNTPLLNAISSGNIDVVKLFAEKGADFAHVNNQNQSALYLAACSNDFNTLKFVSTKDTVINKKDNSGSSVFNSIVRDCKSDSIIDWLINTLNADPNFVGPSGNSILQTAVFYSTSEILNVILPHVKDIDHVNKFSRNALFSSLDCNHYDYKKTQFLVNAGIDVNCMDTEGYTPLINAIKRGKNLETIVLLVESGADKNVLQGKDHVPAIYYLFKESWRAKDDVPLFKKLIDLGLRIDIPEKNNCDYSCLIEKSILSQEDRTKILTIIENAR